MAKRKMYVCPNCGEEVPTNEVYEAYGDDLFCYNCTPSRDRQAGPVPVQWVEALMEARQ